MDFVVIVTKGHYIESAIQGALCLFDEHTACMAIQNGMGNVDILSKYVDKSQIYASIVQLGASMPGPGKVEVLKRDGAMLSCGPVVQEEPTDGIRAVTELLTRGGLDAFAMTRAEINQKIWRQNDRQLHRKPLLRGHPPAPGASPTAPRALRSNPPCWRRSWRWRSARA